MSQLELSKQEPQEQFEPQNRFPSCVFMKLHSAPTQLEESASPILTPTSRSQAISSQEIDLKLTIRFGRQEIKIENVKSNVWFGLKRGVLRLRLEKGKMPVEKMGLTAPFPVEIEIEEQQEKGNETGGNFTTAPGINYKDTSKTGTKAKYKIFQCRTEGDEIYPVWVFEAKIEKKPLEGQLTGERLGTVEITDKPCSVEAKFEIRGQRDLHLFNSEGLLQADSLSNNKSALLTTELFRRLIEPKLQPWLSRVEVQL